MHSVYEQKIYEFMGAIYEDGYPVVFKGGMVLPLAKDDRSILRDTLDIDSDWYGVPPEMEVLEEKLNKTFSRFPGFSVKRIRDYVIPDPEKGITSQSAGFNICYKDNVFTRIDISMRQISSCRKYYIGEISFEGYDLPNIVADKLAFISTSKVPRRPKDILDLYSICIGNDLVMKNVLDILEKKNRSLDDFSFFLNNTNDVEHAYNSLKRVTYNDVENTKPAFETVYNTLSVFIKPFRSNTERLLWNHKTLTWQNFE